MKLATLNLEGTKHLPDQLAWLRREQPDVFCVQECFRSSLSDFASLGYRSHYVPCAQVLQENRYSVQPLGDWGVSIFSRVLLQSVKAIAYKGKLDVIPEFTAPNSGNRVVLIAELENEGRTFRVATTHHTWTPGGEATPEQWRDTVALLQALSLFPSLILCGDFNAPRGGEIWAMIANRYRDNLPPEVKTTIDAARHYASGLQLVVDGLFSTPDYQVDNVRVHTGVSDHCAISAEIR